MPTGVDTVKSAVHYGANAVQHHRSTADATASILTSSAHQVFPNRPLGPQRTSTIHHAKIRFGPRPAFVLYQREIPGE